MKASPANQKELLRLQSLDTKIQQVEHQAKALPQHAELTALSAQADTVRMKLAARNGELEDVRIELGRTESDVDVVEKRIARDAERLQHTSSVKDVQALETELAALKKRLFDLEEIEITVMERLEEREAAVAETDSAGASLAGTIAEAETARDAALADLRRQLGELRRDREAVSGQLPDELTALYEKRRVLGHGNGAALLRARTCGACTITLTGSDLESVRKAPDDEIVFCPDCGAVLVRTDESGI